jgi:putative toxin-antitoxin system antitoxin component (TIGR02293 family)
MDHKLAQSAKPPSGKPSRGRQPGNVTSSKRVKALPALKSGAALEQAYRHARKDTASGGAVAFQIADLKAIWGGRFTAEELEALVIPRRTMARRKARREALTVEEVDKALRLARVASEAERVFANRQKALAWLRSANSRLAGQAPLSLLKTEVGALIVEEFLGQIDHGMFA